ncbi:MAG: hypothetical protein Q8N36_04505 [bacterium]|nr:hypothetical protein [bacterium]
MEKVSAQIIQNYIQDIKGVISSKVVLNEGSEVTEIHVLSDDSKGPRQIVRDVETLLIVKCGLAIDHKKISVVQFAGETSVSEDKRISLSSISSRLHKGLAEVAVTLTLGEKSAEAVSVGANTVQNQSRLVATATVTALKQLLGGVVDLIVEDVAVVSFARREVAMVGIAVVASGSEDVLMGAAYVRGDVKEALVKATLDAVNRRCQRFII